MIAPEALQTPERYTAHGRETLDRIRDHAGYLGDAFAGALHLPDLAETLAEVLFTFFCEGNVIKYEDRAGLKGPREADEAKADFYRAMSRHVGLGEPDPRSARVDFWPYERMPGPFRGPESESNPDRTAGGSK